jgi:peptidoglycan/xylan/chitin deacetylase (PgdA/CDA1 family)
MRAKAFFAAITMAAFLLLTTTGCSADTLSRSPAHAGYSTSPHLAGGVRAAKPYQVRADRAALFRKWHVNLLDVQPMPPSVKPVLTAAPQVPVVSRVPLPADSRVVFLTIDDGVAKDPAFVEMMQDLRVPFSMFLTDRYIRDDYSYFAALKALGDPIENHTLTHPDLRSRSAVLQRAEICGQQGRLYHEYGTIPGLFRPPYGGWNESTRSAVRSCRLRAIVTWSVTAESTGLTYETGATALQPGDIILMHFRDADALGGRTMPETTAAVLREVAAQGFTLARLEDYV